MAKNKGFANALYMEKLKHEYDLYIQGMTARMQVLDKVTITLGRMGFNGDDLAHFEDEYCKTEKDYCETVLEDTEEKPKTEDQKRLFMCEAQDKIDKALQMYVREDRFVPYKERYNFAKNS